MIAPGGLGDAGDVCVTDSSSGWRCLYPNNSGKWEPGLTLNMLTHAREKGCALPAAQVIESAVRCQFQAICQ